MSLSFDEKGWASINSIGIACFGVKSANSKIVTMDYDRIHYLEQMLKLRPYISGGIGVGKYDINNDSSVLWILLTSFSGGFMKNLGCFGIGGYSTVTICHVRHADNLMSIRFDKNHIITSSVGIKFDYRDKISFQLCYTFFPNFEKTVEAQNGTLQKGKVTNRLEYDGRVEVHTLLENSRRGYAEKNMEKTLPPVIIPSLSLKVSFLF
ncbi:hypothetical protein [Candidatus Fokinia crypta]|uniref:Uncharacterized protein n=1 Tax=Candidatus Fokinia crypta TaxID=1920990 RepID=A0ABZ0UR38_9RICK|nr:hypothetical protein [Candidatus Fokinia cryptica]WPX97608.1 hypothetical protein Fokcrypt_00114 [Candidatus Fokinia cryptica]